MTLSTNLSNLHRDKQMFKYPTQAAGSGSTRWDRSRIRAASTRFPLKQVQNGQIVAEKRIPAASQLLLHRNNRTQRRSRSPQLTAAGAEQSCRWPLLFSTSPIHDPRVSNRRIGGELSVRKDAAPGDKVSTAAVRGVCNPVRVLSHNSRAVRFRGQGSLLVRNISLKDPNHPNRTSIQCGTKLHEAAKRSGLFQFRSC